MDPRSVSYKSFLHRVLVIYIQVFHYKEEIASFQTTSLKIKLLLLVLLSLPSSVDDVLTLTYTDS